MTCLGQKRAMQAHIIGFGEERFEIDELDAERITAAFLKERIAGEHAQSPAGEFLSDRPANLSETNQAKGPAGHPINRFFAVNFPTTRFHFVLRRNDLADAGE